LALGLKENALSVTANTTAVLGGATNIIAQVHLGGQSFILGVSAYNAGAALID
jgi:hypothetical protein